MKLIKYEGNWTKWRNADGLRATQEKPYLRVPDKVATMFVNDRDHNFSEVADGEVDESDVRTYYKVGRIEEQPPEDTSEQTVNEATSVNADEESAEPADPSEASDKASDEVDIPDPWDLEEFEGMDYRKRVKAVKAGQVDDYLGDIADADEAKHVHAAIEERQKKLNEE